MAEKSWTHQLIFQNFFLACFTCSTVYFEITSVDQKTTSCWHTSAVDPISILFTTCANVITVNKLQIWCHPWKYMYACQIMLKNNCHGKSQNLSSVFYETLVAHLRLTVYMYQWSAVCASSSPILKFNISEASWPILMKSYMKHHWGGGKASGSHHNLKLAVHLHFFHIFAPPNV